MASRRPTSFRSRVKATLDEVLTVRGFAEGQGGEGATSAALDQVIYCAAPDGLARWSSMLPNLDAVPRSGCFDIVIDGSEADGVVEVRLEGVKLDVLLDDVGPYSGDLATDLRMVRKHLVALLPA